MKLASFRVDGVEAWGCVDGTDVLVLGTKDDPLPDLKAAIAAFDQIDLEALAQTARRAPIAAVEWLPVVPNPDKILCVGLNYETHRKETAREAVSHPTIFTRFASSQTAHRASILRPFVSEELDFEGELAIVIGRPGRHIAQADAAGHVAGYACYNDASVRDYQHHTHQFTPGKNFPETGAFGPWLVTPDEVGDLASLRIETRVNGEVMQSAKLSDMIFGIPELISYCSAFTRLEPGDVIATGTPGGVGMKRNPPIWLKAGDTIEVEIDRIGLLRNDVADEL